MAETQTFSGSCHCGAVRYEVDTSLEPLIACNCSICSRKGLILTFVAPEAFRLRSGEESLKDYLFNKHVVHHRLCQNCGVEPFANGVTPNGAKMVAINVRCLEGIDVAALNPTPFNGRDT